MIEKKILQQVKPNKQIEVVVILAKLENKFLFCKHKSRDTFELPGGHIEDGETCEVACKRELFEETGAIANNFKLFSYFETNKIGAIYICDIVEIKNLPNFEMNEVKLVDRFPKNTTYPNLYNEIINELNFYIEKARF